MVRINASGNVCAKVFPGNTGGMAINNFTLSQVNFTQHTGITAKHTGEIHYFPQTNNPPPPKHLANILRCKASS
ncbi:hypothetical protein ES703_110936 [subsurface metagenome]